MIRSCIAVLLLVSLAPTAKADLIFSITPTAQVVTNNGVVTFDLFFQSDVAGAQIQGFDILVIAGPADGSGSGGVFTAGTTEIGDATWFFDDPGQAFLAFNLAPDSYETGPADAPIKFASLTLDLSGKEPGSHLIRYDVDVLNAIDTSSAPLGVSSTSSSYTVATAVPEPSCIFLGMAAFGACLFRRRDLRV